ncbi:aromatic amino acid lyase [Jinshanibacter sp. LJY008]|uniref:Aromatic amino acid lyase n=1 Tax=Limnobaculum eriocheiris TaxID=2897391 RepID=A0A9X1SNF6_9GAMM|nr:aromatic amino acid ammonia-lyase [Limnobaculum eriocheiris]MCD1124912.1 aromatic amino acid lyase [Limnobaculum eriocheiris]
MKNNAMFTLVTGALVAGGLFSGSLMAQESLVLNGHNLTLADAWSVAAQGKSVKIDPAAMERVKKSNQLLMLAAEQGVPVYGLTVGVGLNKDKSLFDAHGRLSPEVVEASKAFNRNALRAHGAGVGPDMPVDMVRLAMVIRLNTMLTGATGAQPYVAELYEKFLNQGITPVVPSQGSVGEADITLASHIGDAMMGEWRVSVNNKVIPAGEALKSAGITPLDPIGKDALSILSTNAISTAYSAKAIMDAQQIVDITPVVFGLSLEGLNGNISPVLPQNIKVRPFSGLDDSAKSICDVLTGSYLWEKNDARPLQDPLSFRTTVFALNEAKRDLVNARQMLSVQMNSSDDNPAVILDATQEYADNSQVKQYYVQGKDVKGAIYPSANFEPLPLALAVQKLSLSLGHLSHNSVQRTLHLSDDHFTGLSRFLTAKDNPGHAFGAIQKPQVALHSQIVDLVNPVSLDGQVMAGTIEDTFTNNLYASQRLQRIVDNMNVIYGLELLHSTQAIDLRKAIMPKMTMGNQTEALYQAYRKVVPFVDQDRIYSDDIKNSADIVAGYHNQK